MTRPTSTDMRIFRMNVEQDTANGCWQWHGRLTRDGYPTARLGGREQGVHRWVLLTHKGAPPTPTSQAGHTCHDHAVERGECSGGPCIHRLCVNPAHLQWQSPSENTKASDHHKRRVTECPAGHPYDDENTRVRRGRRECLACERERSAGRRTGSERQPGVEV